MILLNIYHTNNMLHQITPVKLHQITSVDVQPDNGKLMYLIMPVSLPISPVITHVSQKQYVVPNCTH